MKPVFRCGLAVAVLPIILVGCAGQGNTTDNVTSGNNRVYNPQTREYEWNTPGQPSTSPGADHTSRQGYR